MAQVQLKDQIHELTSCRVILQQTLCGKQQKNRRYSLRAFARDLKVSPSFLSEVLNGKYGISKQLAAQIADRLGFGPDETQHFCELADTDVTDSRMRRRAHLDRHANGNVLGSSRFHEMEIEVSDRDIDLKIEDLQNNIRQLLRQTKSGTFMLHIRS